MSAVARWSGSRRRRWATAEGTDFEEYIYYSSSEEEVKGIAAALDGCEPYSGTVHVHY